MKHLASVLAILGLASCASIPQHNASPCIALQLECAGSRNILVVGKAAEQTELLNSALSAAKTFEGIFGVTPGKTVIVPGGVISAEHREAFEHAGYPVSLPWISAADKAMLREASIRQQVEAQTKDLPEAIRAAALSQALAATQSNKMEQSSESTQEGAFSHELGHLWFMDTFKPANAESQKGHAYGGWAPDWLDETAAILMENTELTTSRRKAFKEMSDEDIIQLNTFLSMEHPAARSAKFLNERFAKDKTKNESRAIILTGDEAKAFLKESGGDRAANFYSQTQAFSDFLLSYSGDTQLYVSLTEDLLSGGTFETWLASQGTNWGLPNSLSQLDQAWQDWVNRQR